jgi:cytochrome c peroxidase
LDLIYKDNGLGDGKFKIPGLRNVELTGPYMHDGRFETLEDVVNHYSEGIKPHKHLDVKFTDGNGNVKPLNLTTIEKKALVAFLKTLTDKEMAGDPRWSNPFKS